MTQINTQIKNYFIPHTIIKVGGLTRHTFQGEKYWILVRGSLVFQVGFLDEEAAKAAAERINSGKARVNPDLWKDKMPKDVR